MAIARRERVTTVWLAAVGTVLVLGYAALAVVQILVLNPMAAAPGIPLAQIYSDMAEAGETMNTWFVVVGMSIGPIVALAVLVVAVARHDITPVAVTVSYLTLLTLGPLAYFVASFGPGMSLADTYGISGADYSPWAQPLFVTSAAALIALVGVFAAVVARRSASRPA